MLTIDLPVADLNAGSILSPSFVPPDGAGASLNRLTNDASEEQISMNTWIMTLRPAAWLPLGPTRMGVGNLATRKEKPDQLSLSESATMGKIRSGGI
jgi:hypothetical protein